MECHQRNCHATNFINSLPGRQATAFEHVCVCVYVFGFAQLLADYRQKKTSYKILIFSQIFSIILVHATYLHTLWWTVNTSAWIHIYFLVFICATSLTQCYILLSALAGINKHTSDLNVASVCVCMCAQVFAACCNNSRANTTLQPLRAFYTAKHLSAGELHRFFPIIVMLNTSFVSDSTTTILFIFSFVVTAFGNNGFKRL